MDSLIEYLILVLQDAGIAWRRNSGDDNIIDVHRHGSNWVNYFFAYKGEIYWFDRNLEAAHRGGVVVELNNPIALNNPMEEIRNGQHE